MDGLPLKADGLAWYFLRDLRELDQSFLSLEMIQETFLSFKTVPNCFKSDKSGSSFKEWLN